MDREAILKAQDLEVVAVSVPEWGGSAHLRVFSGIERDAIGAFYRDNEANGYEGLREFVCALSLCDEGGKLLFDTSPADLEILKGKSAIVLDRLMEKALQISGLGADAVEDEAKN